MRTESFFLGPGSLAKTAHASPPLHFRGVEACGLEAGRWLVFGFPTDFPPDQRTEDRLSLTFDSDQLERPLEILGFPRLTLNCSADQQAGLVVARLCDVEPGGGSTLVTRGLLNLAHRGDHEHPAALEPGSQYVVCVTMSGIAHRFEAGHRIRVAISPTYWPWAWPSVQPVTLTVLLGGASSLALPGRDPATEPAAPQFLSPEMAPSLPVEPLGGSDAAHRRLAIDAAVGRRKLTDRYVFFPAVRLPDGTEYVEKFVDEFSIEDDKPLSATVICRRSIAISRAAWQTRVEAVSTMTGDEQWFHVTNELAAYEGPTRVFARTWSSRHQRQFL